MRALVTGAAGFAGQWLCGELVRRGWKVTGTMLGDVIPTMTLSLEERREIRWLRSDVRRHEDVVHAINESNPDAIFHLAGVASQGGAASDPAGALDVNVVGTGRLLACVGERRRAGTLDPVVLVIGSGEQYGRHDSSEMPLRETAEQRPLTVYAASKAAQEVAAMAAFRGEGIRVIAARSFNHSGRGQADSYLLPALVKRALALRASWTRELSLGNTTPIRDFTHVEDVARAYVLLAAHGEAGEAYNVASGCGIAIGALAESVLAHAGVEASLRSEPALVRSVDVPVLVGDAGKLRATTGWSPEHDVDSIIEDLLRASTH